MLELYQKLICPIVETINTKYVFYRGVPLLLSNSLGVHELVVEDRISENSDLILRRMINLTNGILDEARIDKRDIMKLPLIREMNVYYSSRDISEKENYDKKLLKLRYCDAVFRSCAKDRIIDEKCNLSLENIKNLGCVVFDEAKDYIYFGFPGGNSKFEFRGLLAWDDEDIIRHYVLDYVLCVRAATGKKAEFTSMSVPLSLLYYPMFVGSARLYMKLGSECESGISSHDIEEVSRYLELIFLCEFSKRFARLCLDTRLYE